MRMHFKVSSAVNNKLVRAGAEAKKSWVLPFGSLLVLLVLCRQQFRRPIQRKLSGALRNPGITIAVCKFIQACLRLAGILLESESALCACKTKLRHANGRTCSYKVFRLQSKTQRSNLMTIFRVRQNFRTVSIDTACGKKETK